MSDALQKVDVGILTFREDELAAVQERFPPEKIVEGQHCRYGLSRMPLDGSESYCVATTRIVQMTGSGDAGQTVRHLVEDLAPSVILLVGRAATMPSEEITLGDVVVATRIVTSTRDESLDLVLKSEPMHKDVARWASNLSVLTKVPWQAEEFTGLTPMLPFSRTGYGDGDEVVSSLKQHFTGPWGNVAPPHQKPHTKRRPPRPAAGTTIAIGRASDDAHVDWVHSELGEGALAIETKSWDAYVAARELETPLMSIRGISEIIGLERDPRWGDYACKVAASFALAFLKTRPTAPRPSSHSERSTSESLPDRPINLASVSRVSQLALSNVRGFGDLSLALKAPAQHEKGQWAILLGDNGVGKTTILRALALALAPSDVAPLILARTGPVSPTVRAFAETAVIRLGMPGEEQVTTLHIEPIKGGERLARRVHAQLSMPFVVAYGSRRGSGLTGAARGAEFIPVAAVETLFDEGANLIQPDGWLKDWQLAALQGGEDSEDARFFDAIVATLCALLPDVEQIHVSREAVEVEGRSIGRVPLGALSDGYRTTMGWVLDMVARWVEEAKRQSLPVDRDFNEKMTGFALIDEIDLHLHPRWQREAIGMVRRHFPRMSFVVTTHNPLTLLGAQPGEIHVLTRNEQGDVGARQRDLPPGVDAEQVLTGDWFGLASTLDDATLELLARHQRLILEEGLEGPQATKVEEELRRRLGSYADTSIERLAHAAAAQVVGNDVRRLTHDEQQEARVKIADLLREGNPRRGHAAAAAKGVLTNKPRPAKTKATPAKPKTKARRAGRAPR